MESKSTLIQKIQMAGQIGKSALKTAKTLAVRTNELNFLETGDIIMLPKVEEAENFFGIQYIGAKKTPVPVFVADVKRGKEILPIVIYMSQFTKAFIKGEELQGDEGVIVVKTKLPDGSDNWIRSGGTCKEVVTGEADYSAAYLALCEYAEKNKKQIIVTVHEEDQYARNFIDDTYYLKKNAKYYDFDWK